MQGLWLAAVLSCGPNAALSHEAGAQHLEIRRQIGAVIEVIVPADSAPRRRQGIRIHRRSRLTPDEVLVDDGIPVTNVICTLVDLAVRLERHALEAAINEADKRGLANPEQLRTDLGKLSRRPGIAKLRQALDERTFTLTDSELERRFLPLAGKAGLSPPLTQQWVCGFKVDFYWPELGLVVETDGLRYHRTPAQQAQDHVRDQTLLAAGLTPLRFTHGQIYYTPAHVQETLQTIAGRLRARLFLAR
jgi:Protein of unknown function (DUF559)